MLSVTEVSGARGVTLFEPNPDQPTNSVNLISSNPIQSHPNRTRARPTSTNLDQTNLNQPTLTNLSNQPQPTSINPLTPIGHIGTPQEKESLCIYVCRDSAEYMEATKVLKEVEADVKEKFAAAQKERSGISLDDKYQGASQIVSQRPPPAVRRPPSAACHPPPNACHRTAYNQTPPPTAPLTTPTPSLRSRSNKT